MFFGGALIKTSTDTYKPIELFEQHSTWSLSSPEEPSAGNEPSMNATALSTAIRRLRLRAEKWRVVVETKNYFENR